MKNGKIQFKNKDSVLIWLGSLEGKEIEVTITKRQNNRTEAQNNALHRYYGLVAKALNDAGLTIEKVIQNFTMEHQWTKNSVKELLWRTAQEFAVKKQSTTKLDKLQEIDKVYEIVNRFLAKLKVESIKFPSIKTQFEKVEKELLK